MNNTENHCMLVVIGASAGGMQALKKLVAQLPEEFPAPIFIVNHMGANTTGEALVKALNRNSKLACQHARHGQVFEKGNIYLAPSDQHILIVRDKILVTKGARENRSRPAIDPLFRSAAVAYGNHVIGIILTGYLDDGTSGMMAIRRCGGICIAQDPLDADYPDMPQSVIANVGADYCLPIPEMGATLANLVRRKLLENKDAPEDIVIEAKIAQRVLSDLSSVEALGAQVPFNCPDCGGVLWKMAKGTFLRYRCHTGHALPLRCSSLSKRPRLKKHSGFHCECLRSDKTCWQPGKDHGRQLSSSISQRTTDSQVHIDRIRAILKATDELTRQPSS